MSFHNENTYSVFDYGTMINDKGRMHCFENRLRSIINKDSVVLDIGAGTGIFALLACKLGARQVYAIEPSDAISVAISSARANGFSDRIRFIQDYSRNVTLPEKSNVLVHDLHGSTPFLGDALEAVEDAKLRLLTTDAKLIPIKDELYVSIVESPEDQKNITSPWDINPFGIDLSAGSKFVTNNYYQARIGTSLRLLSDSICWNVLDYQDKLTNNHCHSQSHRTIRDGIANGIYIWFDSIFDENLVLSNHPNSESHVYGCLYFPFDQSVAVFENQKFDLNLKTLKVNDNYIWQWNTRFYNADNSTVCQSFNQNTLNGYPFSVDDLAKRDLDYTPQINDVGKARSYILTSMTGAQSIEEIAVAAHDSFPLVFPTFADALAEVCDLAKRFGE